METEKSFSGEEAEKDFCGRLFFLAAIFPFSNEKACLGVTAKTDFFYRLKSRGQRPRDFYLKHIGIQHLGDGLNGGHAAHAGHCVFKRKTHKALVFNAVELRKLRIGLQRGDLLVIA